MSVVCVLCVGEGTVMKSHPQAISNQRTKHFCFPEVSNVGGDKRKACERLNGPGILNHPYFIKDCTNIFFFFSERSIASQLFQ